MTEPYVECPECWRTFPHPGDSTCKNAAPRNPDIAIYERATECHFKGHVYDENSVCVFCHADSK